MPARTAYHKDYKRKQRADPEKRLAEQIENQDRYKQKMKDMGDDKRKEYLAEQARKKRESRAQKKADKMVAKEK